MDGGTGLCLQKRQTLYHGHEFFVNNLFCAKCTPGFHRFIQCARIFQRRVVAVMQIGGVNDVFPSNGWYK